MHISIGEILFLPRHVFQNILILCIYVVNTFLGGKKENQVIFLGGYCRIGEILAQAAIARSGSIWLKFPTQGFPSHSVLNVL